MLLRGRSGQLCSVPWRERGTVLSWANRFVGVPSCPAPPRLAAPPCVAQTRLAGDMFGFWNRQVLCPIASLRSRNSDRSFTLKIGPRIVIGPYSPGRTDASASRPAGPRPAPPPRRAPIRTDPPVVCSGFGFDRFSRRSNKNLLGVF